MYYHYILILQLQIYNEQSPSSSGAMCPNFIEDHLQVSSSLPPRAKGATASGKSRSRKKRKLKVSEDLTAVKKKKKTYPTPCPDCLEDYGVRIACKSLGDWKRHCQKLAHSPTKRYVCEVCLHAYTRNDSLERHRRISDHGYNY